MSIYRSFIREACEVCGRHGSYYQLDIDHVKTRGSGGEDIPSNCMTLCRECHNLKGSKGISYMAKTFPSYREWLIANHWYYCEASGKWRPEWKNKQQLKGIE